MGFAVELSPHPTEDVSRKVWQLRENAERFAREPVVKKLGWLYQVRDRVSRLAERWVRATCEQVRVDFDSNVAGEYWLNGPAATLRTLRLLSLSLADIQRGGTPRLPAKPRRLDNGQLCVPVFPGSLYDRGMLPGVRAEVRLDATLPGDDVPRAAFYQEARPAGKVALVLGAGNVTSIPALDVLHKLFVEGQVVVLKMNPVNAYVGPILEEAMKPLIDQGYLAIVYGGADVGRELCEHEQVDEIHITGSDRTHDAIVWGEEKSERDRRRQRNEPKLHKRITSELGNVTPVVIVPGPYSDEQLAAMAESIAGMVTQNASFNCIAAKMLVLPRGWAPGQKLQSELERVLGCVTPRYAYYPGAQERYHVLTRDVADVRTFGDGVEGSLPWTIVRGLDERDKNTLHFRMEPFCSILSVVELAESDPGAFLDRATSFCNDTLWGTLNAMLFVHPRQLKDSALAAEVETAVRRLRYGAVAINQWSAVAYSLGSTPWGGHPSSSLLDVQSGRGWAHNALMFEGVEKTVLSGPIVSPFRPLWSPLHKTLDVAGRRLCAFEADPDPWRLSKLGVSALRG
ncbi:MAG TPA: aldehyde dehydrogenase family protein [Polyangiaceae bacterium]|nr:aldehyde dehydrogenase family protein [Polyangiaceae bacterium]